MALLVLLTKLDMYLILKEFMSEEESRAIPLWSYEAVWIFAPFVRNSPYGRKLVGPPYANVSHYKAVADPCVLDSDDNHYVFYNKSVFYKTTPLPSSSDYPTYISLDWIVDAMQQLV